MIRLTTSALRAEAELKGKAQEFPGAVERGIERVTEIARQQKDRKIERTYQRAIPKSSKGRPLWKRTSDWQRGQTIEKVNQGRQFGRRLLTIGRAAVYEPILATLPRSKDGVARKNAAAADALAAIEPQVQPVFEQEVRNALGL